MLPNLSTLLSTAFLLGLMILVWVMAQISRRFGEVTHRPPLYRAFYVALGLLAVPLVVRLLAIGLSASQHAQHGGHSLEALLHDIPLALGLTLAVGIAWQYWGWLMYARDGQSPAAKRPKPPQTARKPE